MIIYADTKDGFVRDAAENTLADKLETTLREKLNVGTGIPLIRSWQNSLAQMALVLSDSSIPGTAGIAIEYNIPQTSKRVDLIISGHDGEGRAQVVIVELKQWSEVCVVDDTDGLVVAYTGGANRIVPHPSYQAWTYSSMIGDYNVSVQDVPIGLHPCAYLHNYSHPGGADPLFDPRYAEYLGYAPAFVKGDVAKLRTFISNLIRKGDDRRILYQIDEGKIRPSKSLQDAILNMLKGNREFYMIDEQKVVFDLVKKEIRKALKSPKKTVMIVFGAPGTGKSVVAVNLLAELTRQNIFAQYVSKNSAPRNVYFERLNEHYQARQINVMFRGAGCYVDAPSNSVGVLLCDEAHRLIAKRSLMYRGENQVKEIVNAAKCSIFFLDEHQHVTLNDIGTMKEIVKWQQFFGADLTSFRLESQFRCNGSDDYLAWVDSVLGLSDCPPRILNPVSYDFRICYTPQEVRELVLEKNKIANKSRILAGYCWDWDPNGRNDSTVHDIKIAEFEASWNLGNTATWAIDPDSVREVGCIHTCQGLEFDYVGVIIGPDLRYGSSGLITDSKARAKTDSSLKGLRALSRREPEKAAEKAREVILNTYRTLLTRGMKGCYVYCCDEKLAKYFKSFCSGID